MRKLTNSLLGAALLVGGAATAGAQTVVYYPMNETGGVLADVVNGVNMTPVNEGAFIYGTPSAPAGTYGAITLTPEQSTAFGTGVTGTGQSLFLNQTPNNALNTLAAPLTSMAWVNPNTFDLQRIISGSGGDGNGWGNGFVGGGNQRFTTYGVTDYDQNAGTTAQAGVWQHVAVTFDGSTATFYLNGEQVDVKTGGNFGVNPNEVFGLFGLTNNSTELFNGTIDEVKVFNTVLTADQIAAEAVVVPEPASLGLLGAAGLGLLARRRRR